jgi:BON domain
VAAEPEAYLLERIRDALAGDPRVSELHVQVSLSGNRVYVAGTVPSDERRSAIAEVVRSVAPDLECRNQTTVERMDGEPGVEELP